MSDKIKGRPYSAALQRKVTRACRGGKEIRLTRAEMDELGHTKKSSSQAIRQMCLECMGGSWKEVELCTSVGCPLWPFRFGKNPWDSRSQAKERLMVQAEG